MNKILYLPLDERPCNYEYPKLIATMQESIDLIIPELEILGCKKKSANIDAVWHFLYTHIQGASAAILSIETLIYGGLLPSRLHQESLETLLERVEMLKNLKLANPTVKFYLSNLIMRTPKYNSSDEEPDYYEEYGVDIYSYSALVDKKERQGELSCEEECELKTITKRLPKAHLDDYSSRRKKNLEVNKRVIELANEGVIEFLAIPQDDSAPYGFTAMDQKEVVAHICKLRVQKRVHMYPGADEVGCTLLARYFSTLHQKQFKIYPLFSSVNSKTIIPLYEDRPLYESLKAHITAANGILVDAIESCDFVLAINTAGQVLQEAWDDEHKDITYSSFRNLREFTSQIGYAYLQGKGVCVADVAFANGGESELIYLLDDYHLWDKLLGYAGWNTSCNTIGTAICTAYFALNSTRIQQVSENKIYRLLEDWTYQTKVRKAAGEQFIGSDGITYFSLNGHNKKVNEFMKKEMLDLFNTTFKQSFLDTRITHFEVFSPWNRFFEIGLRLKID